MTGRKNLPQPVLDLALHNPLIRHMLTTYESGLGSHDMTLAMMIVELARENAERKAELLRYYQNMERIPARLD